MDFRKVLFNGIYLYVPILDNVKQEQGYPLPFNLPSKMHKEGFIL